MEYEQTKFTKEEVVDVVARYRDLEPEDARAVISLLEKLNVIPPYVFVEVKVSNGRS